MRTFVRIAVLLFWQMTKTKPIAPHAGLR